MTSEDLYNCLCLFRQARDLGIEIKDNVSSSEQHAICFVTANGCRIDDLPGLAAFISGYKNALDKFK